MLLLSNFCTTINFSPNFSSTGSWDLISNMPTPQYNRLVAMLPTNEMVVVGGCTRFKTDTVDIAKARLT